MSNLWQSSPHDILAAWQEGEITFRCCMRMIGADSVIELYAAARSSGVEIKGLGKRDHALLDCAARMLGNRLDTVEFWRQADRRDQQRRSRSGPPATAGPSNIALTVDEFTTIAGREERYELVGGFARPLARADQGHNVIRSNVLAALVPAGKRERCRVTSANTGVRTGSDTIRYPDVVVDGGPPDEASMTASKPVIVMEILPAGPTESNREAVL